MKQSFYRKNWLTLTIASAFFYSGAALADDPVPSTDDNSGFTVLSNATDVTHWGLGAGAAIQASPYRGDGVRFNPIPLIFFDDKWVHAFGSTADLKIGTWDGLSVALRGDYALGDGYKQSDAPALNGLQNRNSAFWYGPALAWATVLGTLSADYLLGGNKGERAKLDFSKSFAYGQFSIEPHGGVEWLSGKYVGYYYGVRSSEVQTGRPQYTGQATWQTSVGTRIDYRLTEHQMAIVDLSVTELGSSIADSPIVSKRFMPEARIGYLYQFM